MTAFFMVFFLLLDGFIVYLIIQRYRNHNLGNNSGSDSSFSSSSFNDNDSSDGGDCDGGGD